MDINDKIKIFLEDSEIEYKFSPGESDDELDSFDIGFKGTNGSFKIRILTSEEKQWILILGFPQFVVPKKYMEQGIRAANKMNADKLFVLCTVDPDDGEVCFRMAMHLEEESTPDLIGRGVWTVCGAVDNDTQELMENIFRNNAALN